MATKIPVSDIVQALGGKENVAQAAPLRHPPAGDAQGLVQDQRGPAESGPRRAGRGPRLHPVQVIIGAEVNNVYKEFVELTAWTRRTPSTRTWT